MPPAARNIALMLILAASAGRAAQTSPPARPSHVSSRRSQGQARPSPLDPAIRRLSAAISEERDRVRQASFEAPVPAPEGPPTPGAGEAAPGARESHPPIGRDQSATLAAPQKLPPIPFKPQADSDKTSTGPKAKRPNGLSSLITVGSSLALVLGLFFLVAWLMRRAAPHGLAPLPTEVLEVLGQAALANRQRAQLLRCGNKLLLVSVTQAGVEPLTEITDSDEVHRLASLCRQAQPGSATATFRHVLDQLAGRRTGAGSSDAAADVRPVTAGIPEASFGRREGRNV